MQVEPPPNMAYNINNVTTEHIQQYLDENKSLILKILENQELGKMSECAENQARLQRNLMFLAAIADTQPQLPTMRSQPGMLYMRHQQAQPSTTQSLMAAQSSMLYAQAPALQQHQTLHLMMGSGGNNGPAASYVDSSLNPNVNESYQMASRVTVASKNEVAGNETSPGRQGGYPTGNYGSGGNFPLYSKVDGEDN